MGLTRAAAANLAVLGRSIERDDIGLPLGLWTFLNFISADIGRTDVVNASTAITGHGGEDRGTLGEIKHNDKIKYDLTVGRLLLDLISMFGIADDAVTPIGTTVAITNLDQGASPNHFTVDGDQTANFHPGDTIVVSGSTGNDGTYTVGAGVVFDTDHTDIDVTISIPDPTTDGDITRTVAWTIKIRPSRTNLARALSLYLFEGGSYSPQVQYGRNATDITLTEAANKRIDTDITYTEPLGDSIYGAAIAKSTNSGTRPVKRIAVRGRRPYDADFDAGKSVYVKVTALLTSGPDTIGATCVAKVDDASGHTDGTGFGAAAYGDVTFDVTIPSDATGSDGWAAIVDGTTGDPINISETNPEDNEPLEFTLGGNDLSTTLADLAVNDEFEIPPVMAELTKVAPAENRLSMYHLVRLIGTSLNEKIDSGTLKIEQKFKPYYANGKRLPFQNDPSGKVMLTAAFKKRRFDRFFRVKNETYAAFTLEDRYELSSPIAGTTPLAYEGMRIFVPRAVVSVGPPSPVSGFDVLDETVTVAAEQPDDTDGGTLSEGGITVPDEFDDSTEFPFQINLTVVRDPSAIEPPAAP